MTEEKCESGNGINIHKLLSSIFNDSFDKNDAEVKEIEDDVRNPIPLPFIRDFNTELEEPTLLEDDAAVNTKSFVNISFYETSSHIEKVIVYRRLEIIKLMELFRLLIELHHTQCIHLIYIQKKQQTQHNVKTEDIDSIIKDTEKTRSYITNYLLTNKNYILDCISTYKELINSNRKLKSK
jgi:hypothetical protein